MKEKIWLGQILSIGYLRSLKKSFFAGVGALQGESLQDEPRLRGSKLLLFNT